MIWRFYLQFPLRLLHIVHKNKATTSEEFSTHLLEQQQQRWFNRLDTALLQNYQLTLHYLEQSLDVPDENTAMFSFLWWKRVKNCSDSGNLVWFLSRCLLQVVTSKAYVIINKIFFDIFTRFL